jgi:hypothetical protein
MATKGFTHGNTTFNCENCGKLTRYTGVQSLGCKLCPYCYEKAGWENMLSDGNCTQEEFDKAVKALRL